MTSSRLANLATLLVLVLALVVTGFNLRDRYAGPKVVEPTQDLLLVEDWEHYVKTARHRRGPANASVTILEFSDFQCPACARASRVLDDVLRENPDVAHVYRHFPLQGLHPAAIDAARASECAADQGRFFALHDTFFARQDELENEPWEEHAALAGIADPEAFRLCMAANDVNKFVQTDLRAAEELNLTGTPAIIVNGTLVIGLPPQRLLQSLIDKAR